MIIKSTKGVEYRILAKGTDRILVQLVGVYFQPNYAYLQKDGTYFLWTGIEFYLN